MCPNPQETADLVTFTEEILNGKLHFFVQSLVIKSLINLTKVYQSPTIKLIPACQIF